MAYTVHSNLDIVDITYDGMPGEFVEDFGLSLILAEIYEVRDALLVFGLADASFRAYYVEARRQLETERRAAIPF